MKKAEMTKAGQDFLKANKKEKSCIVASDGNIFLEKNANDARNHARRENLEIIVVSANGNSLADVPAEEVTGKEGGTNEPVSAGKESEDNPLADKGEKGETSQPSEKSTEASKTGEKETSQAGEKAGTKAGGKSKTK